MRCGIIENMAREISPATETDAPYILAFIQRYFPYFKIDLDTLLRRMKHPYFIYFRALENEDFAGYVELQIMDPVSRVIRLNAIAVSEKFQGKGIGQALLESRNGSAPHDAKMTCEKDNGRERIV